MNKPANMNSSSIIPPHNSGKQNDLTHSVTLEDREAVANCFKRACKRLQNPPVWHELCGDLSATMTLWDASGGRAERLVMAGDFIRIDIPGPGSRAGEGYDWVRVEAIEDGVNPDAGDEYFAIRLRPAANPRGRDTDTAHFFKDTATSSFIIERHANTVTASYHGRNEVPNKDTSRAIDNLRNTVITAGAFAGLSELQWTALIKGFLAEEIGG